MKKALILLVMVIFNFPEVFAEDPYDVVLVPRDVYIGDVAELSFAADIGNEVIPVGESLVLSDELLPSSDTISIQKVVITRGESVSEVRITFIPWVTGRISFPAIPVNDSTIHPPDVTIASLLDDSVITALEPARSPLLVPGTTWLIYGGVLGVFLVIVCFWFVWVRLRRWFRMNPERRIAARRTRLFLRVLRMLDRKQKTAGYEWWYSRLSVALKQYLSRYYSGHDAGCLSLTGTEIAALSDSGEYSGRIMNLFTSIDRVRFSGSENGVSRSGLLKSAGELFRSLEERTVNDLS